MTPVETSPDHDNFATVLSPSLTVSVQTRIADVITHPDFQQTLIDASGWLVYASHGMAEQSGWWIDTETGEDVRNWPAKFLKLWVISKLALCMCEGAESIEGARKDLMDDHLPQFKMRDVELADIWIRVGDLAGGLGVPLGEIVVAKMAYNAQRADHKLENRVKDGGKSV